MAGLLEKLHMKPSDVLLPTAVATWLFALSGVDSGAINDWGLLPALPVAFFVALGLLVASIALALTDPEPSPVRLGLHIVVLVVVLHGTVPLLFPEPNYPWVYKHVGVVGYIDLHRGLDPSVDIYQNWPGFFAVAAWFTRIAGVGSPLAFAKWAPLFFNLVFCLELAWVLWALPLARRTRWLALFLFVAANWVGQDYFAPQALAFGLSLAVYAIVLTWLRVDRRPALARAVGRIARRVLGGGSGPADGLDLDEDNDTTAPRLGGWAKPFVLGTLIAVFAVVVVGHQLSPYLVLLGLGLLAAAGFVRPRWVVVALAAITLGYLALHLSFLRGNGDLAGSPFNPREILGALSNPFDNAHAAGFDTATPLAGRRITALGSPALILGLWALAGLGAVRRIRAGRPALLLVLLAAAPAVLVLGQNYGGEAIFRIYLFSLPWTVALGACALTRRADRRPAGAAARDWASAVVVSAALSVVIVLFMSAFYGSIELYRVRPGAVAADQYFYDHARPGSVLGLVSPNVASRVSGRYDQFMSGSTPPALSTVEAFEHHLLGAADLPALAKLYSGHVEETPGDIYLALSADQQVYVEVLGLMPAGALDGLDRALASSPEWELFYRNADAVIYRFLPG